MRRGVGTSAPHLFGVVYATTTTSPARARNRPPTPASSRAPDAREPAHWDARFHQRLMRHIRRRFLDKPCPTLSVEVLPAGMLRRPLGPLLVLGSVELHLCRPRPLRTQGRAVGGLVAARPAPPPNHLTLWANALVQLEHRRPENWTCPRTACDHTGGLRAPLLTASRRLGVDAPGRRLFRGRLHRYAHATTEAKNGAGEPITLGARDRNAALLEDRSHSRPPDAARTAARTGAPARGPPGCDRSAGATPRSSCPRR
jgi:hypothetical protein